MQDPFIGNVILFGGTFAPVGWAFCDGSLLPISENDALFSLIGTTYGGDGQVTFGLPDLRGRMPIHQGQGAGLSTYVIGQMAGTESVTLLPGQVPPHSHTVLSNSATAGTNVPNANFLAAQSTLSEYIPGASANSVMSPVAIANSTGGGLPHSNIMPSLAINYIIALQGIYPPQS
ncbi:phage tail protein [Ferruginibacter sp. SUN106]|uniref:phage tail protein n=1 Tax=Ferruginibacter sp. SUN106 TaxID=2978348 RepID=UPI003D36A9D9